MINTLSHILETVLYPDRWKVDYVTVEFDDGETLEFEDPDYWGAFDFEYIVLPKNQDKQIRLERDSIKSAEVTMEGVWD